MKILVVALLAISPVVFANTNADIDPIINRIDERINSMNTSSAPEEKSIRVDVPLDLAFKREAALWTSITAAYDHLRSYDLQARHRFLYFVSKVNTKPYNERVEALKRWLKEENHLISSLGTPAYFTNEWKKKTAAINEAINGLEAPAPTVEVKPEVVKIIADDKAFLSEIKDEIQTLASAVARESTPSATPKPEVKWSVAGIAANYVQYVLYFVAIFVSFLVGFTTRKSKENEINHINEAKKPEVKIEVQEAPALTSIVNTPPPFFFEQGVNLEDECKKIIDQNSHLLQLAQLNVVPAARSPFKTSVDAPAAKVSEALSWLLKGTIAIANSNNGKPSHLEWNCREQHGRVSLEFVLHGVECDLKALYLNTLVEGEGSAPAHFGRSEMALSEHLASVGFKSGNKRTTVSLGLDTLSNILNH